MGLEIILFIAAILSGILIYWRESNGNGLYRFVNKLVNNKALQMKASDKKGFIFKQSFLPRLVFVSLSFLIIGLIIQFVTPINIFTSYYGISSFASVIVGTLIGTYIANFVIKSGDVIEDKSDVLSDIVKDTVEKGKEIIEEVSEKTTSTVDNFKDKINTVKTKNIEVEKPIKDKPTENKKSARERLKDKGYL